MTIFGAIKANYFYLIPLIIFSIALKCLWQKDQLPRKTFATVGVSLNPNKSLPIPNYRQERANLAKYVVTNEEKAMESKLLQSKKPNPMVEHLEELAKQRAESKFRSYIE